MESGIAFLSPQNALQTFPEALNLEYAPTPFSVWRPCIPLIERRVPPTGPVAWAFRIVRVAWVVVCIPTWIGLVLLAEVIGPRADMLGPRILPRRKTWCLAQKIGYPLLSRTIWAITFGFPPTSSSESDKSIPLLARMWYGRRTSMHPIDLAFSNEKEEALWIQNDARDPAGRIRPQSHLPGFWIRPLNPPSPHVDNQDRLEVILHMVGGGYITGHPLEASRVFDIARLSGTPVLGVNYRKSVNSERAFPAALQDVVSAYAYLMREGFKRIAVAGDSAGAGLALALVQYLAQLSQQTQRPDRIVMPEKACLYSPWGDLTSSTDFGDAVHYDIIHPTMTGIAAAAYTSTAARYPVEGPDSLGAMKAAHPLFSTALKSAIPALSQCVDVAKAMNQSPTQFLIFYGGAEIFHKECIAICENLREAGLKVEEYCEEDEVHGFLMVPTFMSPRIQPALDRMAAFLR